MFLHRLLRFHPKRARPARVLLWNLMFLLWSSAGAVAVTHADLLLPGAGIAGAHVPGRETANPRSDPSQLDDAMSSAPDVQREQRLSAFDASRTTHATSCERGNRALVEHDSEQAGVLTLPPSEEPEIKNYTADSYADEQAAITGGGGCGYVRQPPAKLEWLQDHQNREGYWSSNLFSDDTTRTNATRSGNLDNWSYLKDYGVAGNELRCTSMALLTFVGAGYDHKEGDYRATCRAALIWMRKHQLADGSFDNANDLRDHALVTYALCDCYGLSGDSIIMKMAEKAVAYLLSRRAPGSGWGEQIHAAPDAISTGYAILAVKSAKMSGVEIETDEVYAGVGKFMQTLLPEDPSAAACYNSEHTEPAGSAGRAPIAAACWVTTMLLTGNCELDDADLKAQANRLVEADHLPEWKAGRVDLEYWWFASLALYQVGGSRWKKWQQSVSNTLLDNQRGYREVEKALTKADLDEHGSWDSVDTWSSGIGRVECTGFAAMTLEVYYRYLRLEDTSESN